MAVWTFLFLISIHIFDTGTPVFTVYDDKFVSILYRRKKVIGYCTWNWRMSFGGKMDHIQKPGLVRLWTCLVHLTRENQSTDYNTTFLSVLYHAWESYRLPTWDWNEIVALKIYFQAVLDVILFAFCWETVVWFRLRSFLLLCMPEKVISYLEMSYESL